MPVYTVTLVRETTESCMETVEAPDAIVAEQMVAELLALGRLRLEQDDNCFEELYDYANVEEEE